jgi:hypothetical protein
MSWLLIGLAAWLAVSLPLALLIVRTIAEADREADADSLGRLDWHPLHVVGADGEPSGRRRPSGDHPAAADAGADASL